MNGTFVKSVTPPADARRKTYQDTQEILQDVSELSFFPANASKDVTRNNYITNPFPGKNGRLVLGLSFELVKQFITTDAANSIDPIAIINGLKDAGIVFTADNDYKEFLRGRLSEFFNFKGTNISTQVTAASSGGTAPALTSTVTHTVTIKSAQGIAVPNPFLIAPSQTFDLGVKFVDSSMFPTGDNWDDSGQGRLFLRATIFAAEITPDKLHLYK